MSTGALVLDVEIADERVSRTGGVPPDSPPARGGGGEPPSGGSYQSPMIDVARLGMLIFLGAETMLFAGFVAAFLVFRLGAPVWPPPSQPRLPVEATGANTAALVSSGYTLWRALRAGRSGDQIGLARGLALTVLLGAFFLSVQGYEWVRLLDFGLTVSSGVYGAMFYTLIGAHAVHVLGALAWLSIVLIRTARRYTAQDHQRLSVLAMYWYFVVALWPVLYTLVYLA